MSSSNKRKMSKSPSKSKPKSTIKTKRKSNTKSNTSKPYHFTQYTLCDVDTDGRCKVIQHSTHKDNLDDLQCSQCTNEWIPSENKWVCVFDGCDKLFCDGCIRKDKAKTPRSLLTKTKRSRFEVSSDSDEYTKQSTPSTTSEISDSEVSEPTTTDTMIKNSLYNNNNNRKRKIEHTNNDNEPLHKRRKLNQDNDKRINADSLRCFMENERKYIKCLEKENIELRSIGLEVLEENKCLKDEGMKCIKVIDGLKAENKGLRDKMRRIMEFINGNNDSLNGNNVNSDVLEENKEDVVGGSGDIEEGEIVERTEDGEINHNTELKKECTTIEKLQLIEGTGYQMLDGVMDLTVESD